MDVRNPWHTCLGAEDWDIEAAPLASERQGGGGSPFVLVCTQQFNGRKQLRGGQGRVVSQMWVLLPVYCSTPPREILHGAVKAAFPRFASNLSEVRLHFLSWRRETFLHVNTPSYSKSSDGGNKAINVRSGPWATHRRLTRMDRQTDTRNEKGFVGIAAKDDWQHSSPRSRYGERTHSNSAQGKHITPRHRKTGKIYTVAQK